MKKVKVVLTGLYPKFNATTGERSMRFNYVVVSGDVEDFVADKTALGFNSIQDEGDHKGKPRTGLLKDIGETAELIRVLKKDGTYDWYTDDMEQMLEEAYFKSESIMVQQENARDRANIVRAKVAVAKARLTAQREEKALAETKNAKTQPKLNKG